MEKLITKTNLYILAVLFVILVTTSLFVIQNSNKDEEKSER